jgi:hypothetical protein
MQICVAGWYYNEELLKLLKRVNERHNVAIIAHRPGDSMGIPTILIENVGLEFHMYNYFLTEIWDGSSKVLFMHDDISLAPVIVNNEIIPATNIFNKLADIDTDQGYVFQDEQDADWNNFKHGRMILMSARLLKKLKEDGGIWYDKNNDGHTMLGPYNDGIDNFHEKMINYKKYYNTCNVIFAPALRLWRRNGRVKHGSCG